MEKSNFENIENIRCLRTRKYWIYIANIYRANPGLSLSVR